MRLSVVLPWAGALIAGLIGYGLGSLRPPPTALVVPDDPQSVVIQAYPDYSSLYAGRPRSETTVERGRQLSQLTRELNQLPPFAGSVALNCGSGSHYYRLRFSFRDGDQWTVDIENGGCGAVTIAGENDAVARVNAGSPVLKDIDALIGSQAARLEPVFST